MQQKPDATKNATGVDTSNFASLKADVDGLNIDKLEKVPNGLDPNGIETTPVDLNMLSDILKTDVVKKTE